MTIQITLKCPNCGGTQFKASSPVPTQTDVITCSACGSTIDLVAEKKRLEKEARDAAGQRLKGK